MVLLLIRIDAIVIVSRNISSVKPTATFIVRVYMFHEINTLPEGTSAV